MLGHSSSSRVVALVVTLVRVDFGQCSRALGSLGRHTLESLQEGPLNLGSLSEEVVTVLADQIAFSPQTSDGGLSRGSKIGIAVGATVGGLLIIMAIGLLGCFLRRKKRGVTKKHRVAVPDKSSRWSARRDSKPRETSLQQPTMLSEKRESGFEGDYQTGDLSDTSFVLPELGGKDPHIKFDGMEWVDIKGLDDGKLQDISGDLRLYQKRLKQSST